MAGTTLSNNAMKMQLHINRFGVEDSVNAQAFQIGWGWHRTNNALIELGYR